METITILNLNSNHNLSEIDNAMQRQVYGGRLPDANETALILATRNTDPSRAYTGAILNNQSTSVSVVAIAPGSNNNTVAQKA
jgi:hypothetical protein